MPLDPAIPLSVQPFKIDILAPFQHVQQLRSGQLGLQSQELQLQEQQRQQEAQQNWRQVYLEAGGNPDKAIALGASRGVDPSILLNFSKAVTADAEAQAKLKQTDLENQQKRADLVRPGLQAILEAEKDPVKQQALWDQDHQTQLRRGLITAADVAAHPYPGPEGVRQYAAALETHNWVNSQAALMRARTGAQQLALAREKYTDVEKPLGAQNLLLKGIQVAGQTVPNNDRDWQVWHPTLPPSLQARISPMYSPAEALRVREMTITPKEQAELTGQAAGRTETARHNVATEAATTAAQAETKRHNLTAEQTARVNAGIAAGHLAETYLINGLKYGPGTSEYWVKQIQENPDSIKEMPPELRTSVGKGFTQTTGLPLPTPLNEAGKNQETAARNALDGITFIRNALVNPEIRKNIGPILGRLGEVEQRFGAAPRLTPEAAALAQELRTRMRYFVFQEGKAVLSGRLPQQLMKQLEESSAAPKMDPATLSGALAGAEGNARAVMDNADRQRFGGKMRPRSQRGMGEQVPAPGHIIQGNGKRYQYKGSGDTSDLNNYTEIK